MAGGCDSGAVDVLETATCTFRRDPRGFVHAVMRMGCEMDRADAKANVAATFALGGHAPTRVLVDMRGVRSQTREARQYFAGAEAADMLFAVALLIGSPVSRVLGNFFLALRPQQIPTALFVDEGAAIAWVLDQHR